MITIKITGAKELTGNFRQLPLRAKDELTIALKAALRDIRDRARTEHKFTTRSGETERGIEFNQTGPLSGVVGVTTKIGAYLHEGTGIYGAKGRPIVIVPKSRAALRWATGEGFAFSKRVVISGIKGDPFLYKAARKETAAVRARFGEAIRKAAKL